MKRLHLDDVGVFASQLKADGVRWETFFTHGESTAYGEDEAMHTAAPHAAPACC